MVLGELSLDASIRAVAGILPAALHAGSNDNHLICPKACGGEAAWAGDLDILAPQDLLQLINHMKGTQILGRPEAQLSTEDAPVRVPDLSEVKGQELAKRALEITAAGGHNLIKLLTKDLYITTLSYLQKLRTPHVKTKGIFIPQVLYS